MNKQKLNNTVILLTVFIIAELFCVKEFALSAKRISEDFFITLEVSKDNPYEREANYLTLTLHSKIPDIAYANVIESPYVESGNFNYINRIDVSSRGRKEIIDGEEYFSFPLQTYVFTFHDKGNYTLSGGTFEVGINMPVVYDDPFWGRTRGVETSNVKLVSDKKKIKVRKLPTPIKEENFCDVVGDFEIATVVPPGDIIINEPCTAIITVKGKGLLGNDVLPEYAEAFHDEVKLKSMSENRKMYFDGKDIVSELQLECDFIPQSADAKIGAVKIVYFNPETGKYETAVSDPVDVKVKSITSKIQTIDI